MSIVWSMVQPQFGEAVWYEIGDSEPRRRAVARSGALSPSALNALKTDVLAIHQNKSIFSEIQLAGELEGPDSAAIGRIAR